MSKTAKNAVGEAVSTDQPEPQATVTALATTKDGDVSGPMELAFSSEMQDKILSDLLQGLHQVKEGFGELTAPTKIAALDQTFNVIDAITIPDYLDKTRGEELVKHVFKLEFADGVIKFVMQGDARPRAALAAVFQQARLVGKRVIAGPYKYAQKAIPGQPQAAWIFEQQPGFDARLV